jgi:hypothetical protein
MATTLVSIGKYLATSCRPDRKYMMVREYGRVARRFELSIRIDNLGFQHHQVVAVLPDTAAMRLLAKAKAGELLREMKENGTRKAGGGKQSQLSHGATIGLLELGITRDQSSQWQRLAAIPAEEFENEIRRSTMIGCSSPMRLIPFARAAIFPRAPSNLAYD